MGRVWHRYTTDTDFLDCTHTHIQCTCGRYRYTPYCITCGMPRKPAVYIVPVGLCSPSLLSPPLVCGHCHLHIPCFLSLGFNTGTGKPVVFPKQVQQVQVRFWFLAHCDTLCTHTAVSQIFTVYYNKVRLIFCVLNLVFSLFSPNSLCHTVTQSNMAVPAMHTSFTSSLSPPQVHPRSVIDTTLNILMFCRYTQPQIQKGKHTKYI